MTVGRCDETVDLKGLTVRCEREHAHGGSHRATIDDKAVDPDYAYVVSWWPTPAEKPA